MSAAELLEAKAGILEALAAARRGDAAPGLPAEATPLQRYLAALQLGDLDDAWTRCKQLATEQPELPWGETCMGRIYVKWKLRDQALGAFGRALRLQPGFPVALVERGIGERAFGLAAAARSDALAALAQAPRDGRALQLLAQLDDDAGATAGLLKEEYALALSAAPQLYEARAALAALASAQGTPEEALRATEELARAAPRDVAVWKQLALLRTRAGDAQGAAQAYLAAVALGDGTRETLTALADAQHRERDAAGEEQTLQRLHKLEPQDRTTVVRLAQLHAGDDDGEALELDARALLAIDAHDAGAHYLLALRKGGRGDVLGQLDELDAAAHGNAHADAPSAPTRAAEARTALRAALHIPAKPLSGPVHAIYAAAQQVLRRAYEARLATQPGLRGTLVLRITIAPAGAAEAVQLQSDSVADPSLTAAIMATLKEASWPPGAVPHTFRFELGARAPVARAGKEKR